MSSFFMYYIDLLWLPLAWFIVHKEQRLIAVAVIAGCIIAMRLQVECIAALGYPQGVFGLLDWPLWVRGIGFYSFGYVIYLSFLCCVPERERIFAVSTGLSVFFTVLAVSTVFLVL